MTRFIWSAVFLTVLASLLTAAAPADSPSFPARIDFPSTQFDAAGVAIPGTGYSPEGIAVSGTTFYAGSTATGEIIKGDLATGTYQRNWVPASPNQPSAQHRGGLGLLVDDHNRLWFAGSYGLAVPATPTTPAIINDGEVFVYDATTGELLAAYRLTTGVPKTINDLTISHNTVYISNTTAPTGPGSEVQYKIPLGPGGALPAGGEVSGGLPAPTNPSPAVAVPTPGFTGADGIDTLPNGNVIMNSVTGASIGDMVVWNTTTDTVTPITVTPEPGRVAKPLLSGDGVALDGNMLYYPENRQDTALCPAPNATLSCPGDIAAVQLNPPDYTTATVLARLNSPAGSGLPPLRSPANTEQLGHLVYVISRVLVPNPVTGVVNVTQTFIEHIAKLPVSASGSPVNAVEGAFSGPVATVTDPNTGGTAAGLTATIDWGDGTAAGTGTATGGAGSFTIGGSHDYAEEGSYTVTTKVIDAVTSQLLATTTSTATVADAPLTATGTTVPAVEGSNVSGVVAKFSDADPAGAVSDYTATIDWGDGSPVGTGTIGDGFTVSGGHTYAEEGTYKVTVAIADTGGSTASTTSTLAVADAALTAGLINASCGSGPCAATFGFSDANPGATIADFTATIDWGDNSSSAGVVSASGGGFVVSGTHVYADDGGGHAITFTVTDAGGSTVKSTAPAATAMLLAKKSHGEDDGEDSSSFTVVATCSSGTATALLNGVAVKNGDVVRLKLIKKGGQKVRREDGRLTISATSFQLVVTCIDAAGNHGSAATSPVFKKRGHDESESEFRHHDDD